MAQQREIEAREHMAINGITPGDLLYHIAQLERDLAKERRETLAIRQGADALNDENEWLRAEVERLKADAARLGRWLNAEVKTNEEMERAWGANTIGARDSAIRSNFARCTLSVLNQ